MFGQRNKIQNFSDNCFFLEKYDLINSFIDNMLNVLQKLYHFCNYLKDQNLNLIS